MEITVVTSFNAGTRGCIIMLRHFENGLPEGTVLQSTTRPLQWKVRNRQMFMHSVEYEKKFANETVHVGHLRFADYEKGRTAAIEADIERNERNEFEYIVFPVDHAEKPADGEILYIKSLPDN